MSFVGVDVGGTNVKIALVSAEGRAREWKRLPTHPHSSPKKFVAAVCAALRGWKFRGLGLALAGGVDAEHGRLLFAPNLRSWEGFAFKKEFARKLHVPIAVENDANAAVWGVHAALLGKKYRDMIGVTLGTGVGGGIIVNGKLYRGANGWGGEIGHTVVVTGGTLCHCGRRGCLEAYAGAAGLSRMARKRFGKEVTPEELAKLARRGNAVAKRIWDEAGAHLGRGLSNAILLLNPSAVVVIGGVARAGNLLLQPVRRVFAAETFHEPFRRVKLLAPAEREWGCLGAALLSRESF